MSHDIDELYQVYDEKQRRAQKQHTCCACSEPIESGHVYWSIGVVFDGSAERYKRCLRCQEIHKHLRHLGDNTWPAERLDCGEEYEEHWGEQPPPEIAVLAFMTGADMQTPQQKHPLGR